METKRRMTYLNKSDLNWIKGAMYKSSWLNRAISINDGEGSSTLLLCNMALVSFRRRY